MDIPASNPYLHLERYRQPVTIRPIDAPDLITIPEYEKPELSPEQRLDLHDRLEERIGEAKASYETRNDELRELTARYIGLQSKKSQWEIYMSAATGADMHDDAPDGVEFYRTLREIREQNNLVKAYALYRQNAPEA